ncbi:ABC transporter permease [Halovulum sp. GXIMD14794]
MAFLKFLAERLLSAIPLLIGISIVAFSIINLVPGDFVDAWAGKTMAMTGLSEEEIAPQVAEMRERYGLNQPLPVQYVTWMKNILLHGDFGMSFAHNRPVTEVIGLRLPRTILLALIAIIIGQSIGILLGIYAAANQYRLGDTLATVFAFMGVVIPKFVVSLVLLYLLAFVWHSPYIGALQSPEYILQDHFSFGKLWDFFLHVWPIILISVWAGQAYTLRVMRGNMLDVMNMQYIETARAKGLSRRSVLFRHAAPNALHAIISDTGSRFSYMVQGEIEIAIVLGVPTLGPLILSSVADRDMYVLAAIVLMVATLLVIGNLLGDMLLALVDPRVRREMFGKA